MPQRPNVSSVVIGYIQPAPVTGVLAATPSQTFPNDRTLESPGIATHSNEFHDERERAASVYNQATIHQWEEPLEFVAGKQPVPVAEGISTKLLALPSRSVSRNLWSYSAKIPVVNDMPREGNKT